MIGKSPMDPARLTSPALGELALTWAGDAAAGALLRARLSGAEGRGVRQVEYGW